MEGSTVKLGLVYTAGRIACFAAVGGLLYLLGVRAWALVLGSVLLSMPLSFFLLKPVRLAWSARLDEAAAKRRAEKEKLRAALRGDDAEAVRSEEPAAARSDEPAAPAE